MLSKPILNLSLAACNGQNYAILFVSTFYWCIAFYCWHNNWSIDHATNNVHGDWYSYAWTSKIRNLHLSASRGCFCPRSVYFGKVQNNIQNIAIKWNYITPWMHATLGYLSCSIQTNMKMRCETLSLYINPFCVLIKTMRMMYWFTSLDDNLSVVHIQCQTNKYHSKIIHNCMKCTLQLW